jgi:membrane associated rhomboid family serine protease
MLIPLKHEQMSARRWPLITFLLIAINTIVFVGTSSTLEEKSSEMAQTKLHLLILAASRPELSMPEDARTFTEKIKESKPGIWKQLADRNRQVEDAWEAHFRMMEDEMDLQAEMDSITARFSELSKQVMTENYAFVPAKPTPLSYLTANFLHGGWLHLIFNMWFLWLAGFVLEDVWGRPLYLVFYLIAGIAALQFYAWMNPASIVPTLGASGAVAGLMGAFLVRFPKLKIEMAWVLFLGFRLKLIRFTMAAFWLLPFWLASEIFSGTLFGATDGVAHWSHVGGFIFGAAIALVIKASGIEHKINAAIEEQIGTTAPPEITAAMEHMDATRYDDAIAVLQPFIAKTPHSTDALLLLEQIYWRKGDYQKYYETSIKSIEANLKSRAYEAAWHGFEEFVRANGDRAQVSSATLLAIGRAAEALEKYEAALKEYEWLAKNRSAERPSLDAQLSAAKLYLKRLNQPEPALKLYEAAATSKLPHMDVLPAIEAGLREAKTALGMLPARAATTA